MFKVGEFCELRTEDRLAVSYCFLSYAKLAGCSPMLIILITRDHWQESKSFNFPNCQRVPVRKNLFKFFTFTTCFKPTSTC